MPAENLFHNSDCECAMHNGGFGVRRSHSDGCPRIRPVVEPRSVMLRWPGNPNASAAVRSFLDADLARPPASRLPPATSAFLAAPLRSSLTLAPGTVNDGTREKSSDGTNDGTDAVDTLIDAIALRVQELTPSGTPGVLIETAISSTLERVEQVVVKLEDRISSLADQRQVNELNMRIDKLVDDIPVAAAAAVNESMAAAHFEGTDLSALSDEVRASACERILSDIPQVVENYLSSRVA